MTPHLPPEPDDDSPDSTDRLAPRIDPPARRELLTLLALMIGFLLVNVGTADRSPIVWLDEVMFVDPAFNALQGEGFVTWAWFTQEGGETFVSNAPLYSLLLVPWCRVVGTDLGAVRSLNHVLMVVAAILAWVAVWRGGLVRSGRLRLLLVALLLSSYGMAFIYRSARYDVLGLVAVMVLFAVSQIGTAWRRRLGLAFIAAAMPWFGLQLVVYLVLVAAVVSLAADRQRRIDAALVTVCLAAGLVGLFSVYAALGLWSPFIDAVTGSTAADALFGAANGLYHVTCVGLVRAYVQDPSLILLIVVLALLSFETRSTRDSRDRRLAAGAVALCTVLPATMWALRYFPLYYSWMVFVPLAVAVVVVWQRRRTVGGSRAMSWALSFVITGTLCVGLPARLALMASQWRARDHGALVEFVARHVGPDDVVACDWVAYFAASSATDSVLPPAGLYDLGQESDEVTALVLRPYQFDAVGRYLGGEWVEMAHLDVPDAVTPFPRLRGHVGSISMRYEVSVYRRRDTAAPPR